MSDSKQVQGKWHAEELRALRKARLASMKAKDGGKKPLKTRHTLAWVITAVILVIALLGTGVWVAVRLGVPQRTFKAVTIGSTDVKAIDLQYYYRSILNYYGIDPTTAEGQTYLKGESGDETMPTMADLVKDQAAQYMQQDVILAANAIKAGMTLDAEDLANIEASMASITSQATASKMTVDNFLISKYGTGMNLAVYRSIMERFTMAEKFATQQQASYTYTDDQIKAYYDANKIDFDLVDYRTFLIDAEIGDGATDEVKTAALAKAKATAEEMLGKITDEESYKTQCIAYSRVEDKEKYKTDDASLAQRKTYASMSASTEQAKWLFDEARVAGNKTIIESAKGYYVLYFLDRYQADFKTVSIRHILISAVTKSDTASENATAEEVAAAKARAEKLLADFLAGDKTEASFGILAKANSADTGAGEGGLYEGVKPGDMVPEFNDWCFDASRKPGDTGIVQTQFGFHIMYYVSQDTRENWQVSVEDTMRSTDYNAYLDQEVKNNPYVLNSFGLKFVS